MVFKSLEFHDSGQQIICAKRGTWEKLGGQIMDDKRKIQNSLHSKLFETI